MDKAELVSLGMCDGGYTSLRRYHGKNFQDLVIFDNGKKWYISVKTSAGEEYFIKRRGDDETKDVDSWSVEQKSNAMEWASSGLMTFSPNAFNYYFFRDDPDIKSDCGEAKLPSKTFKKWLSVKTGHARFILSNLNIWKKWKLMVVYLYISAPSSIGRAIPF